MTYFYDISKFKEGVFNLPTPFLFPELQQLKFKFTPQTMDPILVMPPSLQIVHLYPPSSSSDPSLLPVVQSLSSLQALRVLVLEGGFRSTRGGKPDCEDIFNDSLLQLSRLEVLRVVWLSLQSRTLVHLASLEHLRDLAFWVQGPEIVHGSPFEMSIPVVKCFRALRKLDLSVTVGNPGGLLALLHALPETQLKELSIHLDSREMHSYIREQWPSSRSTTDGEPGGGYMKRLTRAIEAARFPGLRVLKISVCSKPQEIELLFSENCLSHLLALRDLTELNLAACEIYSIPDAFRTIADTWPRLQVLHLGQPYEGIPPFEPPDLLPLVDCRELHKLGVYLCDTVTPAHLTHRPPPGTSPSPVRLVHLLNNEIKNVENLALFLDGAFPLADIYDWAYPDVCEYIVAVNEELGRIRAATMANLKVGEADQDQSE